VIVKLKKFGQILISRSDGREAFLSLKPNLKDLDIKENIIIDFEEIRVLTPGWGDEFLTPLFKKINEKLALKNSVNPTVKKTLIILEDMNNIVFNRIK
jgi:hypothetical protein